jgi:hypothetical protein
MLEGNTLSVESCDCPHDDVPKVIRYTIDIGLGKIGYLRMCQACRMVSNLKYVIKAEVIDYE